MSPPLPPDPYKVLGVTPDAQIPEIRSAHRKLVLKCHPDKVQDPQLKAEKQDEFQRVQQAYELLSDDKKRAKYDDQVELAELRKQMQNKANISSPRATASAKFPGGVEIRTAPPRSPTTYASTRSPSAPKIYTKTSRSYEEDGGYGVRIETEVRQSGSSRRGSAYETSTKRASERDRELRDREHKDRERERRKTREEKVAKELRREEKRQREKQRDKHISKATEDKRKPVIVSSDDDEVILNYRERKKSTSSGTARYDTRERSLPREEEPTLSSTPPGMAGRSKKIEAEEYISRAKGRSAASYHATAKPPAPTPPPAPQSPYRAPPDEDEDVHRSSAPRLRRGSSDTVKSSRSYRKVSMDEPIFEGSPPTRHTSHFAPELSASPPNRGIPRTNSMPVHTGASYPRPQPGMTRSATFTTNYPAPKESTVPRGRDRSRLDPQLPETDSEEEHQHERERERRHKSERKHRSSRKTPERTSSHRYYVEDRGSGPVSSVEPAYSSRHREPTSGYHHPRAAMSREASYQMPSSARGSSGLRYETSQNYSIHDAQYSRYEPEYVRA